MRIDKIIIFCLILFPYTAFASSIGKNVKEGNTFYNNQKYDQAIEKYREVLAKDPNSDIVNFNLGAALYKKKDFDETIAHFQKSLLTEDEKLKEKTHYNLGNAYYKSGTEKEKADLSVAVSQLKQSLGEYEKALAINEKNEDALYNHEFVTKELKRLEKKLQQQQQNQQQQEKNDDSQKSEQEGEDQKRKQSTKEQQAKQNQEGSQSQQEGNQKREAGDLQELNEKGGEKQPSGKEEASSGQMSKEEARMLLEGYRQNEEPGKLLNFQSHMKSNRPVLKDW